MSHQNSCCVTIVTPVFNQASTLAETIESVLAQTYKNIQYIIVNDGSTDGTASVLSKYEDRVTVISQKNQGQAAALNGAWADGRGDYFTYVSADDVLYPDCIERLVSSIDGSAIVYYPDFDILDAESKKVRVAVMQNYKKEDLQFGLVCQPGLAALFSAEAYRAAGGWDSSYRFIPDFEFWSRMAEHGGFRRVPEVLGGFRVHDNSGSIRDVSIQSSDEIIRFVGRYPRNCNKSCFRRAFIQSRLMSSRSHFQCRRYGLGAWRYAEAVKLSPLEALKLNSIHFVLSGAVRRTYYRFRNLVFKLLIRKGKR